MADPLVGRVEQIHGNAGIQDHAPHQDEQGQSHQVVRRRGAVRGGTHHGQRGVDRTVNGDAAQRADGAHGPADGHLHEQEEEQQRKGNKAQHQVGNLVVRLAVPERHVDKQRGGGKGKLIKNPCKSCHGSGTIAVKKTLEANVPAGIDDDQGFRLSGMGNAGTNGGPAGDVIVAVTVQPSEVFQRDENNIYVVFPITYSQAVLGDTITVPSIDGKVEVNVPEGTQSGTTFRLRGKGIQYLNGRGRGDMYVKCEVEIPKKLNKAQRDALKKFEGTLKEENYEKRKGFFKKLKDMFNA